MRDGPATIAAVESGAAHMGVVAGPSASVPGLRSVPIISTALVAIAPRPHPLAQHKGAVEVETLLAYPLLLPPLGRALRATLEDAAASLGRSVEVAVEVTGWEAVCRLATLGVGVGVVNDVVSTPGLTRVPVRGLPTTTYRVLLRRGRPTGLVEEVVRALAG